MYNKQLIGFIFFLGFFGIQTAVAEGIDRQLLVEVLSKLQEEYKVVFSYNSKDVKNITVQFQKEEQETFESAVNRALLNTGLRYKSVGLNFYVIYKDSQLNTQKLKKIKKKIGKIKKLGNNKDFIIYENKSLPKITVDEKLKTIRGNVTSELGEPLPGASVFIVGTMFGTSSDVNGAFEFDIPISSNNLSVSFTGFTTKQINLNGQEKIDVTLKEGLQLQNVTVFGSRGAPRTRFDSSIPIDNICIGALDATGKHTLDEQLTHIVPSFNSGQHPVSDASAHFNPIDLRGLLPSRTLVLVNGKRKNASALLYSYVTASRGEVGVDLKSIGSDAVNAVEVLRDGAAAQYGSDAIAGVINLELKERIKPFINVGYSTTSEMDGTQFNSAGGISFDVLKKGFATFTLGYHQQNRTQRAGTITSAADEAAHWGTSIFTKNDFRNYLERHPKAGFVVGLPDVTTFTASLNSSYTLNEETDTRLYVFGTLMNRRGRSPQFARGPYWVTGFESIYPDQDYFLPEMAPLIDDQTLSVGVNHNWENWKIDLSSTLGNSRIDYFIKNSFNQSLGSASPKDFYNGAHQFRQLVNNLDVNKTFFFAPFESLNVAFGMEQRIESFVGYAGEFASYGDGTPDKLDRIGSESFSGLSPKDAVRGNRNNIGFYTEITGDINSKIQIGGAARLERYSDFGSNISWKFNGLYKAVPDKLNFRTAVSNGFRAPSLHQIYYTSTTTTLTPDGVVQNRILNNLDPALAILKIPELIPETSFNLSTGATLKLAEKISFSLDVYKIKVVDRIVLSGQIAKQQQSESPINYLLETTNTNSAGFFLNAVNTATQGIDLVFNLQNLRIGKGRIKGSLAANFNHTEVTNVHLPSFIEGNQLRDEIFSREDISRLETWRPRQKIMFSGTYSFNGFSTTISVNHFGAVAYKHPNNVEDDAVFGGKIITDCSVGYGFNPRIKWRIGVNNLFNVYPDSFLEVYQGTPNDRNIDFVGRFQYPWQTLQIGIDGIRGFTKLTFEL